MSKILGSWSGMRKYLEQEMIAEGLRGRIRYNCTTYVGMDIRKILILWALMFAILDRRIGKRTLSDIKDSLDNQPEWLKIFYRLRLESEGI